MADRRPVASPLERVLRLDLSGPVGAGDEPTDGRHARADRSRTAVLDALVELISSGQVPTTAEVAAAAGLSERSLFRHFDNRDALFLAAVDRLVADIVPTLVETPPEGPLHDRLVRFVTTRGDLYDRISPLRRAGPVYAARSDALRERLLEVRSYFRQEIAWTFDPELSQLAKSTRADVLDLLDCQLDWTTWDQLRTARGASKKRACELLIRSARLVFDDALR